MTDAVNDIGNMLAECVRDAHAKKKPLRIVGSGNKRFCGEAIEGETISVGAHTGIVDYEPSELYITAYAGTPLSEIEARLRAHRQMLTFEPPHLGPDATLGGCIACGLSGPARAAYGAARDALLGISMINGHGEILRFGGKVMKNVAGYDVTRLMCGSFGTLGVILEVTLRVIPIPEYQTTIRVRMPEQTVASYIHRKIMAGLPISASFYCDDTLYLRLSGWRQSIEADCLNEAAVQQTLSEQTASEQTDFWQAVKEQQHPFFQNIYDTENHSECALWRISVPANSPMRPRPPGTQALEWNGALRWLLSDADPETVRAAAEKLRGQATLFIGNRNAAAAKIPIFHPLKPEMLMLHQRIKKAFDPENILNPSRLYPGV